jgi:signal transduction histidine kinase
VLLLVCTPLFYLAIQHLFIAEMEEELFHHKNNFLQTVSHLQTEDDLRLYQLINEEFILKEASHWPISDSLFSYRQYDSVENKAIPFRALRTGVIVHEKKYQLTIQESLVGNTELLTTIVATQAGLLILLLIGFIFINRKLTKEIWDPFYIILERLKLFQIDKDQTINIPRSTTAEFRDLSDAITQLVTRNREAYLSQKEFTENASHELQTPLAICRSKLELFMQTKNLSKEQADLLSELLNVTDRMARLNKNLLLLSKIENRQFLSRQTVSVNNCITEILETYTQTVLDNKIKVTTRFAGEIEITTNRILLDILLSNLISNAIRYAPEKSEVSIDVQTNCLLITNAGVPFTHPEKVFHRFNRESRLVQGHGLGLAIAKEICEAEGFQLEYLFMPDQHQFKIVF